MAQKIKYSWHLSRVEAADVLHKLAESIAAEEKEVPEYGIQLAELSKYTIKIEMGKDDCLELKFTGKCVKTSSDDGRESYSSLKKRMQIYFKALRESMAKNQIPSREIVSVFLSDSETMMSYAGYGDEFYPLYAELCLRLRTAFEAEDHDLMASVINDLVKAKHQCHERYK